MFWFRFLLCKCLNNCLIFENYSISILALVKIAQSMFDNKWYQGCGVSSMSFSSYSTYGSCNWDDCNPANGLSCYQTINSSRPDNTNSVFCTGTDNMCFVRFKYLFYYKE